MKRVQKSSPHSNSRGAHVPSVIVLHSDASDSVNATLSWLAAKESKVSYHVVIDRDGTAYEVVPVAKRAWHAGVSSFAGITDVNSHSIGLSFANNNKGEAYTAAQVESARVLCREWMKAFPKITRDRITTHAIIAPTRKTDPLGFDLAAFKASL